MSQLTFQNHLKEFIKHQGVSIAVQATYSEYEDFHYQSAIGLVARKNDPNFDVNVIKDFFIENYNDIYEKVEVTGKGFLSVKFKMEHLHYCVEHQPQRVIVDYCGVNIAKQMHIGHIRSMFIGDYVARIHEARGDEVHIFNHIGDWGNQFGFLIAYIMENSLESCLDNKSLTQYYKQAYTLYEEDNEFATRSHQVAAQLQAKTNGKVFSLWQQMVDISLQEAEKTFSEFGLLMNASHTQGESFYADFCAPLLQDLLDKGIAKKESDGSVVVFFDNKSPLVLQKSTGTFLYPLYDLAAIQWRVQEISPDKIIYVVDKRQALHFEQVFDIARKAGLVTERTQLVHLGFGTILGADKKPLKTKSGDSLYLDELFSQGKTELLGKPYYQQVKAEFVDEILHKTIVGGMKFHDLKYSKHQDYVFDWDNVLNFSGNSAPYLQNALVRIDSIFCTKFGVNYQQEDILALQDGHYHYDELERDIIFNCFKTKEIIDASLKDYASQALTTQGIKLCQLFHKYYEREYFLGHAQEKKKLHLSGHIFAHIIEIINILGIEHYDCTQKMEAKLSAEKKLTPS